MQKSFRTTILAIGAVFLASSLALGAQTAPPPAPDAGTPQVHTKTAKTKKQSGKKGARKKARNRKKTAAR
jgi:hypothetical protein